MKVDGLLDVPRYLTRYARTLTYLRPWQVVGRLVATVRQALPTPLPTVPEKLRAGFSPLVPFPTHDPWNERDTLLHGTFTFLNQPEHLGWMPDWKAADTPLLWRFNLHYFHYLHLLAPNEQVELSRCWIRENPPGRGESWHPYPTALRIVNWCRAEIDAPDVLASLYLQAAYLYRHLETYVYGNHLLENARALVLAGRFFDGEGEAPKWLEKGLEIYRSETNEQVFSDGGHFERSPMYHALVLEGYLDVLNVLPADHPDRPWLVEIAERMGDVLVSLTHPDGQLALFNDATQEIAPQPDHLIEYLQTLTGYSPQAQSCLPGAGYYIHNSDEVYLCIDGGAVGPDYLMAHAHADIFSYELSLGGVQIIVDSGVYEYKGGAMRDYVRSTAAHNTVSVDGINQVDCWDSFRVARRAAPHDVAAGDDERVFSFDGVFSGYEHWIGDSIVHRRSIRVDEEERRINVNDIVEGRGQHRIESRVHFHPDVELTEVADGFVLRRGDVHCRVTVVNPRRVEEGWYCPAFGRRIRNNVLVFGGDIALPAELNYTIEY